MKIKAVCDLTGLSDRTIRYYIEQKLIFPSFTENYLGRKTYNFSNESVEELNNIATLRKFDFSIDEIRDIITDPAKSRSIIQSVKKRTEKAVAEGQAMLSALSHLNTDKEYTAAELAKELAASSENAPLQNDHAEKSFLSILFSVIKSVLIFIVVWFPVVGTGIVFVKLLIGYHYLVLKPAAFIVATLYCLPTALLLILPKTKFTWKSIVRRILLVLCMIHVSFYFIMPFGIYGNARSETADINYYRRFDIGCLANNNSELQALFPASPHEFEIVQQEDGRQKIYLDAKYYYHYFRDFDSTYDVYAEWPWLDKTEFDKEIQRVRAVFDKAIKDNTGNYAFSETETENYNCLFLYNGAKPFNEVTDSYTYIIFAYDEERQTVRYICCCSLQEGSFQPYYLQLDW